MSGKKLLAQRTRREEAGSVAREMAAAYERMALFYRDRMQLQPAVADSAARALGDPGRVLDAPADQVSWWDISCLAEHDPLAAHELWLRIGAEATAELASGHRAASVLDFGGSPWQRAQFLALRESFRVEWRPQGGVEEALIDTMAQAQTAYLVWMQDLNLLSLTEVQSTRRELDVGGRAAPTRLSTAEAMEHVGTMADRFNRLFVRTLRALRDLRRYSPAVIVQSAGQVNVGAQQVNIAGEAKGRGTKRVGARDGRK